MTLRMLRLDLALADLDAFNERWPGHCLHRECRRDVEALAGGCAREIARASGDVT